VEAAKDWRAPRRVGLKAATAAAAGGWGVAEYSADLRSALSPAFRWFSELVPLGYEERGFRVKV